MTIVISDALDKTIDALEEGFMNLEQPWDRTKAKAILSANIRINIKELIAEIGCNKRIQLQLLKDQRDSFKIKLTTEGLSERDKNDFNKNIKTLNKTISSLEISIGAENKANNSFKNAQVLS